MAQPFLLVELENHKRIMLNEAQVVSVAPSSEGYAIVRMSNGDVHTVVKPSYDDWEYDAHTRKQ